MTDNTNTRPAVASITEADIQAGKTMAILAYIIFLIPLLASRDNKFAMFHTEQALINVILCWGAYIVLTILAIILGNLAGFIACGISIISYLIWIAYLVFLIMGLLNAAGGKTKELPVIGSYGAKLNLIK
jgi:uncharacterized membrane protein